MIDRKTSSVAIGEGTTRHRVVVTDEDSAPGTQAANFRFYHFMNYVASAPHVLACGYSLPQRVLITHNGKCWQAEAEADVHDDG